MPLRGNLDYLDCLCDLCIPPLTPDSILCFISFTSLHFVLGVGREGRQEGFVARAFCSHAWVLCVGIGVAEENGFCR
jgi:hypothetical protein